MTFGNVIIDETAGLVILLLFRFWRKVPAFLNENGVEIMPSGSRSRNRHREKLRKTIEGDFE